MTSVSILVVTYNSAHVIADCLDAIAAMDDAEVIVYDNASTDKTVTLIHDRYPSVRVIEGPENSGFAVAVNRAATQSSSSRIMLLNPDAVIDVDSVRKLVSAVDRHPLSVVAPLITHPFGLTRLSSAGHFPTSWSMLAHYTGLSRLPGVRGHYILLRDLRDVNTVDWVSGACFATARSTWEAVGGLSERWFMYAEDIDFCWRVDRLGGHMIVDTSSTATHLVGESDNERSDAVNSMWVENLYDFYASRMSPNRVATVWWGLAVSAGLLLRSLVFMAQRRPRSAFEFRSHARTIMSRALR